MAIEQTHEFTEFASEHGTQTILGRDPSRPEKERYRLIRTCIGCGRKFLAFPWFTECFDCKPAGVAHKCGPKMRQKLKAQ